MKYYKYILLLIKHKWIVFKLLLKAGLYKQAIAHDLSKLNPIEIIGYNEPYGSAKFNAAWLHHKGRNKHHCQYWTDINENNELVVVDMPQKYIYELVADWISAGQCYEKNWTQTEPFNYLSTVYNTDLMSARTLQLVAAITFDIKIQGAAEVMKNIRKGKYENEFLENNKDAIKKILEIAQIHREIR